MYDILTSFGYVSLIADPPPVQGEKCPRSSQRVCQCLYLHILTRVKTIIQCVFVLMITLTLTLTLTLTEPVLIRTLDISVWRPPPEHLRQMG